MLVQYDSAVKAAEDDGLERCGRLQANVGSVLFVYARSHSLSTCTCLPPIALLSFFEDSCVLCFELNRIGSG